jgi:hypothetical protein
VNLHFSVEDYLSHDPIPGATIAACGKTFVSDAKGFVILPVPLSQTVSVDVTGLTAYPAYRFLVDVPDKRGWDELKAFQSFKDGVWLPKTIVKTAVGKAVLEANKLSVDAGKGAFSLAIGPDVVHTPKATSAKGATAILGGVSYEGSIAQVGDLDFKPGNKLGVDRGVIFFANIAPGVASLDVVDAKQKPCGLVPSFATTGLRQVLVEANLVLVTGFQCPP